MASKGGFFSKFLAFFLVLIIISGVGFLGYNLISGGSMMNMDMGSNMSMNDNSTGSNMNSSDSSSSQNQMNMNNSSSKQDTMNMGESKSTAQYATNVINTVLQNKDNLQKTIVTLNDALKLMTLDPYGADVNSGQAITSNNPQGQQNSVQNSTTTNDTASQGSTVVNVYPQNSTLQNPEMQNMGITYDTNKMQQLHTGLYKISTGMQLLDQLKDNLAIQLEQASMEVKNPSQYYYNQYLITVQNKNKLSQALDYINEANSLVNINPYISKNGAVYDKDRMTQIHDSIYKLAQAVVDLNKINDNFSRQTISLSNLTQNYINNTQSMSDMSNMNMNSSIFSNLNITTVLNILVIAFIVIFIISIFGYISRLLKSSSNIE